MKLIISIILLTIFLYFIYKKTINQKQLININIRSDKPIWNKLGTYWPMAPVMRQEGLVEHNLWARGGCLEKYDLWMKSKYNVSTQAQKHEKKPFFNWLVNKPNGFYVPQTWIEEENFEVTSGTNIDNDGILKHGTYFDLKKLGVIDGERIESWWWGSCDSAARASLLFREPIKPVVDNGVEFTPHDIKGLLTIISETVEDSKKYQQISDRKHQDSDIIIKTDGSKIVGKIFNLDVDKIKPDKMKRSTNNYLIKEVESDMVIYSKEKGIMKVPRDEIKFIKHEERNDVSAHQFHQTIIKWIKQGPFIMDIDKNKQVWNYSFGRVEVVEIPPEKLGGYLKHVYQKLEEKFPKMLLYKVRVVKATCHTTDNKKHQYLYWLVQDWKMDYVDSGWLSNNAPDFLWRTGLKKDWKTIKENHRNPYVIPYYVNQLYQKSL